MEIEQMHELPEEVKKALELAQSLRIVLPHLSGVDASNVDGDPYSPTLQALGDVVAKITVSKDSLAEKQRELICHMLWHALPALGRDDVSIGCICDGLEVLQWLIQQDNVRRFRRSVETLPLTAAGGG